MSSYIGRWLLVIAFIAQLDCQIYHDRPTIKTADGDLILEPARDKNVYLQPNGPSSNVYIGNVDVRKLNAPKDSTQNQPSSSVDLDKLFNERNGILERLQELEKVPQAASDSILPNITLISRRLNSLYGKLTALQNQISNRPEHQCKSQPCQHEGTCLNLLDGYHCLCPSNWEGKDCDVDVNECRNFAGTDLGCQNGATCINTPGSYMCSCKPSWFGVHCTTKVKDCSAGDFEMCGYGSCISVTSGDGIKCICHQGWTNNGTSVECLTDVDECQSYPSRRCSVNPRVDCINVPGSFRCGQCPVGYEGDGYRCYDVDECITNNGGCSPMVSCANIIGSRICGTCPPGYQGDGVLCTFKGSCNINHGGCHVSAQCSELPTSSGVTVQCVCPEGMDGDGVGVAGCYASGRGVGCENNPCGDHGQCHRTRLGYSCFCHNGYSGVHCDTPTAGCASNPCQNGGICRQDTTSGFRCECTAQYSGSLCEVRLQCGGVLYASEGSIMFPLPNTTYDHKAQCSWVIITDTDKVLNVTFSNFVVELSPECSRQFMQIHDGRRSSSQLIGRFCGKALPKGGNIVSSHNSLYLWYNSAGTEVAATFALHWSSIQPTCGGDIDVSTHGRISSPGAPGQYPPDRDCYWHLTTNPWKRIILYFFALNVEQHANCSFDFLAIYDGEHTADPLLNKFCSSTQPAPVQSASSHILIHFHSDAHGTGNGFQITYAPIEGIPGCGGYFTADSGEISSPTYTGELRNLLCEYKIRTSAETTVKISFKSFTLEHSHRCNKQYLKIYDGPSSESPFVGKFCGTTYPASYEASTNYLYIKYKTDRSSANRGFTIIYEVVCKKTLLGDSGVITSPLYPLKYPFNRVCEYFLTTEPGKVIQLTFQDIDIEAWYSWCKYDYVEVRDGPDINSTLLGKYCGRAEVPPVQTSTYNHMYVRFKSDDIVNGIGFYANYTAIDIQCGGIYRDTHGFISYPTVDASTYNDGQNCSWLILAPQGLRIELTWNRFAIENTTNCVNDYLELIEIKDNNEEEVLGKYCGTRLPPAFTTATNRLKLKFISNTEETHVRYTGFSVTYTLLDKGIECGGNYISSHGYIHSPGWPKRYGAHLECTWTITVPAGQQIALNITDFDLERARSGNCQYGDYLTIRNGGSATSTLIGTYCGEFKSKRIVSLTNVVRLYFHSDYTVSGGGFTIEWDGSIDGCGGTLTGSTGSITSPNYPNSYHENAECFYRIVTSAGSRIRITFKTLNLGVDLACRDDYVAIYDGRNTDAPLGKYCFNTSDLTSIDMTKNYAFIKFRSDFFVEGKGFVLEYITVCNNNLTGQYGVIESLDYPNYFYGSYVECLWTIRVPKGNRINITFTEFDIHADYFWGLNDRHYVPTCIAYLQTKESTEETYSDKMCGAYQPNAITTKTNSFAIKFSSGPSSYRPAKFRLEFVSDGCGGHIHKQFGNITFHKSSIADKEIECEWIIETSPEKTINITFTDIYMFESKNCTTDAIEIYNGRNTEAPLLSKICHQQQTSIESDSNYMLVRFVKLSTLKDVYFSSQFSSAASKCGGSIKAMSGFIYSKNYPRNYENNQDCIWYITVPEDHRIEINFIDFDLYSYANDDLGDDVDCGDTILIYDNLTDDISSNYSYRMCPNSNITRIVTKYHHAVIQFKSNGQGTAKGFKANFSVTCGAVITSTKEGYITNNQYINNSNKSCVWTIIASTLEQKISLTFTHMSLPKDDDIITNRYCPSTFLRVFDGDDTNAPLLDEYCGRKVPPMIVSHGNAITIELGSYNDRVIGDFSLHYSVVLNACGGTMTAEAGAVASPLYPKPYPGAVDCEWVISASPGNTISVIFREFDVDYSDGCNEDYLELRENDGGGKLLAVYCGSDTPTNSTEAAKMYIKFHSSGGTNRKGFLLNYGYLHENDMRGEYGEISSPLYPISYKGAGEFEWRLLSHRFIFTITIDILVIPSQGDVSYNKLTIYDGFDKTAPILEQFHGVIAGKKTVRASSREVFILLTMDKSNTGSIFHLTWTQLSGDEVPADHEEQVNCGFNHTQLILPGEVFVLTSTNFNTTPVNNFNCEWKYIAEKGRHLSITFTDLNILQAPDCSRDVISIFSADSAGYWKSIKKVCTSTQLRGEIEASDSIYIKLKLHSSLIMTDSMRGIMALVSSKCGGDITDQSGDIAPSWRDLYHTKFKTELKCIWTVKVRPSRTIKLRFSFFNITNTDGNCTTSVVLRNGDSIEASLLASGKYCGAEHEKKTDIETSSNALFVSYTSSYIPAPFIFQTFKIHYEEQNDECGLTSTLTDYHKSEIISSPKYPSPPVPYSECVWVFSGPPGEILKVDFIDRFVLDQTDDCGTEVVEIHDGSSSLSPSKGRYCGAKPATVKTSGNTVYIKYSTQLAEPGNGFKANISIDVCGGTMIADSGIVTSPGYPQMQALPYGMVCEWHIIGPEKRIFVIKPLEIYLPQSDPRYAIKIDIEDTAVLDKSLSMLKTICGKDVEENRTSLETISNRFTIRLTYNKPAQRVPITGHRGFRISFESSRSQCGGKITTSEGYLTTPSYPRETTLRYCEWQIYVPDKIRRIRLELIDANDRNQIINIFNDFTLRTDAVPLNNDNSTQSNRIYESVSNKMAFFVFSLARTHRFKAKFSSEEQALCGGDLSDVSKELSSPDLLRTYTCEWHYNNEVDSSSQNSHIYKSILITGNVNSSLNTSQCGTLDSKLIIESPVDDKELVFRRVICLKNDAVSYRIPSSIFDIRAMKSEYQSIYFHLNWKPQPCGGTVYIGTDLINIINTRDSYNDTLDCAWVLIAAGDNRVEIQMEGSFTLDCSEEYLTVANGLDENVIGTYCKGQVMGNPLVTHFAHMYVQYHSNVKGNTSIKLVAKAVSNQCGGEITSYKRTFTSPNYPKAYPANVECAWEIISDPGYRVSLKFIDRFLIEDTSNCTKDVVIVYDWRDGVYEPMARVCGREAPPPYNSTYGRLKVVLRTDDNINLDGFTARWTPICGGRYEVTEQEHMTYSPVAPRGYDHDIHCVYELYSANNQKILLKFIVFDLEDDPGCELNSLSVKSLDYNNAFHKVFCGSEKPVTIRYLDGISIEFNSKPNLQKNMFILSYSLYNCGGRVNDTTVLTVSVGDDDYRGFIECTWSIEAPPTKVVVVKFLYIDLKSSICSFGSIKLYDGLDSHVSQPLARLCGYINDTTVFTSTGNTMLLEFKSIFFAKRKSFKAVIYFSYSEAAGCGGQIDLEANSSRVLTSPLISNVVYEDFLDCRWSITSPIGTVIGITFSKFDIAPSQNINHTVLRHSKCECDLVEIKDGLRLDSLVVGTYCGTALPPKLITSANEMSVRLSTDGELAGVGFEATLTVQESVCGNTNIRVGLTPRRFSSPGYDTEAVPSSVHCSYRINGAAGYSKTRITIVNLQLRPPVSDNANLSRCLDDRLVISNAPSSTYSPDSQVTLNHLSYNFFYQLYDDENVHYANHFELCGHKKSIDFYVRRNTVLNLIVSPDDTGSAVRGFEVEVAYVGFCGRNYTELFGRIVSAYKIYIDREEVTDDCYTLITAPENYTISGYFIDIKERNGADTFLEIFDGNTTSAKQLRKVVSIVDSLPVFSTGRHMLLHSNKVDYRHLVYEISYITTDKGSGCGGALSDSVGAVSSPHYPNTYRRNSICEWVLETPVGTKLLLKFSAFDLGVVCEQNYVQLVDSSGAVVRTFCSEAPADYTSDDHYVKLVFYTTMNNSGKGWSALFVATRE